MTLAASYRVEMLTSSSLNHLLTVDLDFHISAASLTALYSSFHMYCLRGRSLLWRSVPSSLTLLVSSVS